MIKESKKRKATLSGKYQQEHCDFDDMMPEQDSAASTADTGEGKYLPDQWILTRDVLMRVHNKPRKYLFTPNEDPLDPCPLPLKYFDIMRRSDTSQASKAEAGIEDSPRCRDES